MLGFNYRLTDFQCALGISQLNKLEDFIKRRREIAKKYSEAFEKNKNIEILKEKNDVLSSYHLFVIKLKNKEIRLKLFNYLKENNIYCQVHYLPVYLHPYYQKLGYEKGMYPMTENFYGRIISIPIFYDLKKYEQQKVINMINKFFDF